MSLTAATLIPGIVMLVLGTLFLLNNSAVVSMFKSFPRSRVAAAVFFGAGAIWFLYQIAHLSEADFGEYRKFLLIGFLAVAVLSFFYAPDFLAVRGVCVLMLMAAMPLLDAGYMVYDPPQVLLYKAFVYLGIALAIYLGAAPYRMRDFLNWMYARPGRARAVGGALGAAGLLLTAVAFTY